jgi:hypothetical protein
LYICVLVAGLVSGFIQTYAMQWTGQQAMFDLRRELGLWDAVATGIAAMIGAGIFVVSGIGARVAGSGVILAFIIAGVVALFNALSSAELAAAARGEETGIGSSIVPVGGGVNADNIRRCMERDPNARPSSVAQLALALPGGDPLAAAIAAGETGRAAY